MHGISRERALARGADEGKVGRVLHSYESFGKRVEMPNNDDVPYEAEGEANPKAEGRAYSLEVGRYA